MRIVYEYSHLGGSEILAAKYPAHHRDINDVIASIQEPGKTKRSKEKTQHGKMLYGPALLNGLFKEAFRHLGWNELKQPFQVEIPNHPVPIRGVKGAGSLARKPSASR